MMLKKGERYEKILLISLACSGLACSTSPSPEEARAEALESLSQPTAIESFALATDAEFDTDLYKSADKARHSRAFEVFKDQSELTPRMNSWTLLESDLNEVMAEDQAI